MKGLSKLSTKITVKKKRGPYKKKPRIELTPRQKRNSRLTHDILNGMTFLDASHIHSMNSAQAVQKQFRSTIINFIFPAFKDEIIKNNYDLKYLRELWRELLP